MEHNEMSEAFKLALGDQRVVKVLTETVAKKIIELKSKPTNVEDILVKNHVIFAEAGDVDGKWMIAKEIGDAVLKFNPQQDIRVRTFGKALIQDAKDVKQSNKGKQYFVKAIVKDMLEYAKELPAAAENLVEARKEAVELIVGSVKELKNALIEELEAMDKKALKKFIEKNDLGIKTKGMDELNIRIAILNLQEPAVKEKELPKIDPKEAFEPAAREKKLDGAIVGAMSRDELIALIKEKELDIEVKDKHTDIKLCMKICNALDLYAVDQKAAAQLDVDVEEVLDSKKKSKKAKEKKKEISLDAQDLSDLSEKKEKLKKKKKGK